MFDLICDRDGVLNVDRAYVHRIEDFAIPDGVIEGLTILRDVGARFSIATGQSGIARGKYTEEDMRRFNEHLLEQYRQHGIEFPAVAFCPHHPDVSDCECRKPKAGMLDQIESQIGPIDWASVWGIGDKPTDSQMILSKGGRAVLLRIGSHNAEAQKPGEPYWDASDSKLQDLLANPRHFVVNSVLEAATIIKGQVA